MIDQVQALVAKARAILDKAEDQRTALPAVRELRGTLELLAKLTGQLNPEPGPTVHQPMFYLPPGSQVEVSVGPAKGEQREIDITPEADVR